MECHICTYSTEYAQLPVWYCDFCGERRRILVETLASGYLCDMTCLSCGTVCHDGEMERLPRFNDLQWREAKIAKAKQRIAEYRKAGLIGRKAVSAAIKRWIEQ